MKRPSLLFTICLAASLSAAATPPAPASSRSEADQVHVAEVTYAKTVGGYTYLRINEGGKELWLAALPMQVEVGNRVEYAGGDVMTNFRSKAMDRTFDAIRFVSRVHVLGREMPKDDIHKRVSPGHEQARPPKRGEIARLRDGRTVEEILGERDKLDGKRVSLRAKVVKINRNILGKNWITLADGTGRSPDDTLVVTSEDSPAVGEVVTVSGVLKTNVDLGSGYRYKAILEQARFTKG